MPLAGDRLCLIRHCVCPVLPCTSNSCDDIPHLFAASQQARSSRPPPTGNGLHWLTVVSLTVDSSNYRFGAAEREIIKLLPRFPARVQTRIVGVCSFSGPSETGPFVAHHARRVFPATSPGGPKTDHRRLRPPVVSSARVAFEWHDQPRLTQNLRVSVVVFRGYLSFSRDFRIVFYCFQGLRFSGLFACTTRSL